LFVSCAVTDLGVSIISGLKRACFASFFLEVKSLKVEDRAPNLYEIIGTDISASDVTGAGPKSM
jgi:hypothetical protein